MDRVNPCSLYLFSSCLHVDIHKVFILLRWKTRCVFLSFTPHPVPLRWEGSSGDQAMTLVTVWDHHPLEVAAGSSELSSMHMLSLCLPCSLLPPCDLPIGCYLMCQLLFVWWWYFGFSPFCPVSLHGHFRAPGHSWTSQLIGCLGLLN